MCGKNMEGFRSWPLWKAAWARYRVGMSGYTAGTGLRDGATPGFLPEPTMPCPSHQGPVTAEHLCEVK